MHTSQRKNNSESSTRKSEDTKTKQDGKEEDDKEPTQQKPSPTQPTPRTDAHTVSPEETQLLTNPTQHGQANSTKTSTEPTSLATEQAQVTLIDARGNIRLPPQFNPNITKVQPQSQQTNHNPSDTVPGTTDGGSNVTYTLTLPHSNQERLDFYGEGLTRDAPIYSQTRMPSEAEIEQIPIANHGFVAVASPDPYVRFVSTKNSKIMNTDALVQGQDYLYLTSSSDELFSYGTEWTTIEYSPSLTAAAKVQADDNVLTSDKLLHKVGDNTVVDDIFKHLSGELLTLLFISQDCRIASEPRETIKYNGSMLPAELQNALLPSHDRSPAPHPILSYANTEIEWWKRRLKTVLNDKSINYKFGRVKATYDPQFGVKLIVSRAINIDQWSADIMNFNLFTLLSSPSTNEQKAAEIRAYAVGGTTVRSANDSSVFPDITPSPDQDLINFAIASVKDPNLENNILTTYERFMELSGFVQPMINDLTYGNQEATGQNMEPIVSFMNSRSTSLDPSFINRYFALEMAPRLRVYDTNVHEPNPQSAFDMMIIFEYLMFFWIFPGLFDMIKGTIQTSLLSLFHVLYPNEVIHFYKVYGTTYSRYGGINNYNKNSSEPWQQRDYLTNVYPSFWGFPASPSDAQHMPNMVKVRSLFYNLGKNYSDHRALAAKFPRITTSHYIPFIQAPNVMEDSFQLAISSSLNILGGLITTRSRVLQGSSAQRSPIATWIAGASSTIKPITWYYVNHLSIIYSTMANFRYSVRENTDGSLATFKHRVYALVTSDGATHPTISNPSGFLSRSLTLDTSIIWTLLFRCTYGGLDRTKKIPNTHLLMRPVIFPSPLHCHAMDMEIKRKLQALTLADNFLSTILGFIDNVQTTQYTSASEYKLNVITSTIYFQKVKAILNAYAKETPLRLSQTTTPQTILNFITENHKFLLLDPIVPLTDVILNIILTNGCALILPPFIDINTISDGPFNFRDPLSTAIPYFPLLNIASDLGVGNEIALLMSKFPAFDKEQYTRLHDAIADAIQTSQSSYGKRYIPMLSEEQRFKFILMNMMIRRVGLADNSIIPFDPQHDPPAFRSIGIPLDSVSLQRLAIGLKLINSRRLSCLHQGIRLHTMTIVSFAPNFKPDTSNYRSLTYSQDLFKTRVNVDNVRRVFVDPLDQREYAYAEDLPKIHLTINDRSSFMLSDMPFIQQAIDQGFWIVDVTDFHYTARVITVYASEEVRQNPTIDDVLKSKPGSLMHLRFLDGTHSLYASRFDLPLNTRRIQRIFPLSPITNNIIAKTLFNEPPVDEPLSAQFPPNEIFETGYAQNGRTCYNDGSLKVDNPEVSFSNLVYHISKDTSLASVLNCEIISPVDLRNATL